MLLIKFANFIADFFKSNTGNSSKRLFSFIILMYILEICRDSVNTNVDIPTNTLVVIISLVATVWAFYGYDFYSKKI